MYVVVSHILPQIQDDATREPWFDALATLAGGVGTYTMLSKTLLLAMEHVRIVKRFIFGRDDLHGTWIGCFKKDSGEPVITVSYIEQNLDGITVRGTGQNEDLTFYAKWISDSCSVDSQRALLTFTYTCEMIGTVDNDDDRGICVFHLERPGSIKRPNIIHGYSADLSDGKRTENREHRIDDDFVDLDTALAHAREIYMPTA